MHNCFGYRKARIQVSFVGLVRNIEMGYMSNIVYLLGAGVNQSITDWDGLSPPMIKNFFQIALKKRKFSNSHYTERVNIVYEYIEKYWKKTLQDLVRNPFDLEECFTLLELQASRAYQKNDEEYKKLMQTQFLLKSFIAEVLSEFETFVSSSDIMRSFGKVLIEERPTILTFNYDCFIEKAIESASGLSHPPPDLGERMRAEVIEGAEVSDEELAYSHHNWNRPLGYGMTFDKVQLHRAGISVYVEGTRFYSHPQNKLYSPPLLKLHGSLNWFRYLPIYTFPIFPGQEAPQLGEKENQIILVDPLARWWFAEPPTLDNWIIDPIIITPTLYKEKFIEWSIFESIWKKAKDALSECKRLIMIGYSFSPTDFTTKQLFLEALSNHDIEQLIIVNPDPSVAEVAKNLCHFKKKVVTYKNLNEYLVKEPGLPKSAQANYLLHRRIHTLRKQKKTKENERK